MQLFSDSIKSSALTQKQFGTPTFLTTKGGLSSAGDMSVSLRQKSRVRLTSPGEIERERNSDETVGRPYDLLRRPGLGDLCTNNTLSLLTITPHIHCHSTYNHKDSADLFQVT